MIDSFNVFFLQIIITFHKTDTILPMSRAYLMQAVYLPQNRVAFSELSFANMMNAFVCALFYMDTFYSHIGTSINVFISL